MKNSKKGITLIALVITIIVLLILAGISITALTSEDGILTRANYTKEETRYSQVLEEKDKFKINHESDYMMGTSMASSLDSVVKKLQENKVITAEEAKSILGNGFVTINGKTIDFRLDLDNDEVFEDINLPSQILSGGGIPGENNPLWKDDVTFPDPAIYGPFTDSESSEQALYFVLTKSRITAVFTGLNEECMDSSGAYISAIVASAKYEIKDFETTLKEAGASNSDIQELRNYFNSEEVGLGEVDDNILFIKNPIYDLELNTDKVEDFIENEQFDGWVDIEEIEPEEDTEVETTEPETNNEELTMDKVTDTATDISDSVVEVVGEPEYIVAIAFFNNKQTAVAMIPSELADDENTESIGGWTLAAAIEQTTNYDEHLAKLDKILFKTNSQCETYIEPNFSKTDYDTPISYISVVDYENSLTSTFDTVNNNYSLGYIRPVEITQNNAELTAYLDEAKKNAVHIGLDATKILKLPADTNQYHTYIQNGKLYITDEPDPCTHDRKPNELHFCVRITILEGLDNGEKARALTLNKNFDITNLGLILK